MSRPSGVQPSQRDMELEWAARRHQEELQRERDRLLLEIARLPSNTPVPQAGGKSTSSEVERKAQFSFISALSSNLFSMAQTIGNLFSRLFGG